MFVDNIQPLLQLDSIKPRNGEIAFGFVGGSNQVSRVVQQNVRNMFRDMIEPFINVRFVETRGNGDINFQLHDDPDYYAYAQDHDVFLLRSDDNQRTDNGFQGGFGTHGFMTLIHETLHALGLSHPGNYNGDEGGGTGPFLTYSADNTTNTLMSYNFSGAGFTDGFGAITPMAYDIAALQKLYGASNLNANDTTYMFDSVYSFNDGSRSWGNSRSRSKLTIWDKGGADTLDFSKLNSDFFGYRLDARAGGIFTEKFAHDSFVYIPKDYGSSFTGIERTSSYGTTLSFTTKIEKIIGSQRNDEIFAGSDTRTIDGQKGNDEITGSRKGDTIWGGLGNDVLRGENGNDLLIGGNGGPSETDRSGRDELYGGSGKDTLWGEGGNDLLYGGTQDDILLGGSGNDWIEGSSRLNSKDRDQLYGGAGTDRFILGSSEGSFYKGRGRAIIKDWNFRDDFIHLGKSNGTYTTKFGNLGGSSALDTGIYLNNKLIGIVEDSTNVNLVRDAVFA